MEQKPLKNLPFVKKKNILLDNLSAIRLCMCVFNILWVRKAKRKTALFGLCTVKGVRPLVRNMSLDLCLDPCLYAVLWKRCGSRSSPYRPNWSQFRAQLDNSEWDWRDPSWTEPHLQHRSLGSSIQCSGHRGDPRPMGRRPLGGKCHQKCKTKYIITMHNNILKLPWSIFTS